MHVTSLPILALLGFDHFFLQAAANSGWTGSCNSAGLVPPGSNHPYWMLEANCAYVSGIFNVGTDINIGSCFGNSGGTLVGQYLGGFGASCKDISLSGSILSASCGNGAGAYISTSIDTDNWIGNNDGGLYCFNQNGMS